MPIVKKRTQRGDVTCLRSYSQDQVLDQVKCFSLSCCLSVLSVVDRDSTTRSSQVLCQILSSPTTYFLENQSACPGPCPLAPSRRDCSPLWSRIILPCVPVTRVLLLISKEFFQTVVFLIFVTALLYGFLYPVYYS